MDRVLKLVVMGRACRNTANIKNRQPIGQMYVKADFELSEFFDAIVADELNVKNVTFTQEVRDFTSYSFKPQLKTVGPKYGKLLGGIKNVLSGLDGNAAMDELNANGCLSKTLVSVTGLQDVLVGKDGAPISDEAEAVDRKICYYFTDEEFLLPEERLVALAEDA